MSPLTGLAVGMIFSGQIFDEAQSQNCETEKTYARPARKAGGGSGEVKYWSRKTNDIREMKKSDDLS
jgi:hypothetical protein